MYRRPPVRGAGLRPLGEPRRQQEEKPRRHVGPQRRRLLPPGVSPSQQGTPGPGTPRTRRRPWRRRRSPDRAGEARGGPPPLQRPARVNKASTHAAHLPGAAAPRPQSPGPPDQVKPDQRSLTGARRQRRRRADAGRARATYSGGAVPAAPEVFCAGASLPAGVGPRSPEKPRGC